MLLYRLLFALLNIQSIDSVALLEGIRSGVSAIMIIIGIAVGVAIPNIFIHRYIERRKQDNVRRFLERRYADSEDA